jgi:serine phosphatase RsbU (regulator of sigma subunit)
MNSNQDNKIKFGIKLKLSLFVILLVVVLNAVIALTLSYSVIKSETTTLADNMLSSMNLSVDYLSSTAAEGMVALDDLLIINIIKKVSLFKDVEYAFIADRNNVILSHSGGFEKTGQKLSDSGSIEAGSADKIMIQPVFNAGNLAKKYVISTPIMFRSKKIGTAFIGYTTESIFKNIALIRKNILIVSLSLMLGTIVLGIIGSVFVASFTTNPIKTLVEGIRIIGQGDLDYVISVRSQDEIGYLSDEFNKTTRSLKEFQKVQLEREVEKSQLDLAKRIQTSLIPQTDPGIANIKIASFFKTVYGVGGDYYDYFFIGKDRIGVVICDVFGKGLPASLVMVSIRTLIHSYIDNPDFDNPAEMFTGINKRIAQDFKGEQYATMFFIMINYLTGKATCINAGHSNLFIFRRSEGKILSHDFGDAPIGVDPMLKYSSFETQLMKRDVIMFNTDGITEAENIAHQQFTEQRLSKTVAKNINQNVNGILDETVKEVQEFIGQAPQKDDMTLILVEYQDT